MKEDERPPLDTYSGRLRKHAGEFIRTSGGHSNCGVLGKKCRTRKDIQMDNFTQKVSEFGLGKRVMACKCPRMFLCVFFLPPNRE